MRSRGALVAFVTVIVLAVAANVGARARGGDLDLSATRRFSLSPETRALVRAVRAPLHVTAFVGPAGGAARDARFLLGRYRELNHRVSYRVVDPDADPAEAARFGISTYATVVLTYEGRRVDAPQAEELELSTAILRLLRGHVRPVCVLTGHGEPALDDTGKEGFSGFRDLLRHNAYDPRPLDLTTGAGTVPADCAAVVVAGPRDPLQAREIATLVDYAKHAGRLLVMGTPVSRGDPNPLLAPWGLHFTGGLVLDPARSQNLDLEDVIIEDLPSANPVDDGVTRLEFASGGGLLVDRNLPAGRTVSRLAVTSDQGFVETRPDTETTFDDADIPGPVLVAAAMDDSRVEAAGDRRVPGPSGARVVRTRLVVTGTQLWAMNGFLDNLGNSRLLGNAINWLAQEDELVATTSHANLARPLPLTAERQTRILVVTVGIVPGAIVAIGLAASAWRRRRARHAA